MTRTRAHGRVPPSSWLGRHRYRTPATTFAGAFGPADTQITNFTNFEVPEMTDLVERLRTTSEFGDRYDIVEEIEMIINDQAPLTFSAGSVSAFGVRQAVKNIGGWTAPDGSKGDGTIFGIERWGEVWLEDGRRRRQ